MEYSAIPITELIPQRPPFLMVDRVLANSEEDTETVFVIREDNILLDGDHLSAAGLMENMTQSCACRMGCRSVNEDKPIRIGVIGAIKNCCIIRLPSCGETLHTHVCILEEVLHLTLASVVVKVDDNIIATSLVKIAMTDIEAK